MKKPAEAVSNFLSKLPSLLWQSNDAILLAIPSDKLMLPSRHRALLDMSVHGDTEDFQEWIMKALTPVFIGGALAGCVLFAYLLFGIISLCCKCCSSKRGCCQRPQRLGYKERLPYIVLVGLPAILGLIGGVLVLSGGPGLVNSIKALIDALIEQFDVIIGLLRSLYDDGIRASRLAGENPDNFDELGDILDEMSDFRENGLQNFSDRTTSLFGLVSKIAMAVGGVLIGQGILGVVGPATMKNFLMVGFLVQAAILTCVPFVIWGVLTFTGNVTNEICVEIGNVLAGAQTDSNVETIPCPDVNESKEALDTLYNSINDATESINDDLRDANMGSASAFSALAQQCAAFNGTGDYYEGLCTSGNPYSDAQLMTAIYQCVDQEGISSFNLDGALNGFDTSCTWYTNNYPAVDFGTVGSAASIEDCFRTATETIVVGAQFHGIVEAGRSVGATFFNDPSFITDELAILPYACTFDTGTNSMRLISSSPAVMPDLCPPFHDQGNVTVATDPALCEENNAVPFDRFDATYEPLRCTLPDRVFPGGEDVPRRICTAQGTPLFADEFEDMARGAEAISIFQRMLPGITSLLDCTVVINVLIALHDNCHPVVKSARFLASGMLLCGIGFAFAALFMCSCWRKLNKPTNSVEPYNEFK